jgi:hypothetical protein
LTRNGRRLERRQAGAKIGTNGIELGLRPLRVESREEHQYLVDHAAVLEPCQVAAIEVIATADNRFHTMVFERINR